MARKSGIKNEIDVVPTGVYAIRQENVRNATSLYTGAFSGLKPDRLHYYFESRRKGVNFFLSLLFEEIRRRDLRIGAICQTRKLSTVKKEWSLSYSKDSVVAESQQQEIVKFLNSSFDRFSFANFVTDIVEAQIQGLSAFQIMYSLDNKSRVVVDEITRIQNHLTCYDDLIDEYRYISHANADATKIQEVCNTTEDRIDFSKIVINGINQLNILEVHSFDGNSPNGLLNGCVDSLVWCFYFKNYGVKDWATYIERFASPAIIGKRPALMSAVDKRAYEDAVRNFASLSKIILPEGCTLEMLTDQNKGVSTELFKSYAEFWNKEAAIRVLGQSLTTDIGDVGSKAASQTHDEVRRDIQIADMILVKQVVNQLIKRMVDLNFQVEEYPVWKFMEEEDSQFRLTRSEIFRNLYQSGYRVKKEFIEQEFGVEVEEERNSFDQFASRTDRKTYVDNFIKKFFNGIQR